MSRDPEPRPAGPWVRRPEALAEEAFDLLIIGGGITGAGVVLDAVTRGLRVALVEKGDFASGASSASSKLIHGGLRYLEHGYFHLVHESLRERALLLQNAPHLVRPLRFVIPFERGGRVPGWKWRMGLTLYDLLAGAGNIARSRLLPLRGTARPFDLVETRLHGGASYWDAQMDDARLCLAVLQTAAKHGATAINYAEAVAFNMREGRIQGARVRDKVGGQEFTARARQVLNAAGPWVDRVSGLAADAGAPRLAPTKGVHLVLPDRKLPAALLLLHPRDGRVFFVIPWLGKTLLGTTDTNNLDDLDALTVTDAETDYLLEGLNHFVRDPVTRPDVMGSFAGLRPLLRSRTGHPSARSREDSLSVSASGLITMAGGKYTTYRRMAERATDLVMQRLGRRAPCRTRTMKLVGAPEEAWVEYASRAERDLVETYGLAADSARRLVERYGIRAGDVVRPLKAEPALARRLHPEEPEIQAEIVYQRSNEMAIEREDFVMRRMRLGIYRPELRVAVTLRVTC